MAIEDEIRGVGDSIKKKQREVVLTSLKMTKDLALKLTDKQVKTQAMDILGELENLWSKYSNPEVSMSFDETMETIKQVLNIIKANR